ncbi:MAG TPA: sensor domain-containing diguanylate cyclase [Mycobacteriales bacterium]|nr:sensor domain-containing diguanylate cyclase [Mycobacteriales bacterium]
MSAERPRTLTHEVTDAFRIVVVSALSMVIVVSVALLWLIVSARPALDHSTQVVGASRDASASLIDEQGMLRAYVMTGSAEVLTAYPGVRASLTHDRQMLAQAQIGSQTSSDVQRFAVADAEWQHGWVAQALNPTTRQAWISPQGELNAGRLATFVRNGQASFQSEQNAVQSVLVDASHAQSDERRAAVVVAALTAGLLLAIGIATAAATQRRRRRLQKRVVGPIGALLAKVQAVGRGEFGPSPSMDAPLELLELRNELANMSASLLMQQQSLAARADDAGADARRLKLVIEFAREISDSLTLAHVFGAVTAAGRRLLESPRARLWLLDDDAHTLTLRYDSITGDVVAATTHAVGAGGVGLAAQDHQICYFSGLAGDRSEASFTSVVVAVPLVKGTRLIGVLEIALSRGVAVLDDDTVDVLVATAGHAATAIDAALLYAKSDSLSRSDPLTGLANRRQLDQDLDVEVERADRYQRPLTFMMIDIDHFKRVNDTFGHARGDTVLAEVAALLRSQMRAGDTAYRYGGEEFAVLARETDVAGGRLVADRLRQAVAEQYAQGSETDVTVTISVGVATLSPHIENAVDLVTGADRALYAAKRAGRNRVRVNKVVKDAPAADPLLALG